MEAFVLRLGKAPHGEVSAGAGVPGRLHRGSDCGLSSDRSGARVQCSRCRADARDHRCSDELAATTGTVGRSPMTSTTSGVSCDAVGHRQLPPVSGTVGVGDARCRDQPPGAQRGCATRRVGRTVSRSDALGAERVAELRLQIDYLASTIALLPASPRRAAALSAVRAIDRDITELLWYLVVDDSTSQRPHG